MIRKLLTSDVEALLMIEEAAQEAPWSRAAFERCFEAKYPGWVAVDSDKVVGFSMVSLAAGECHILNLCVHPDFHRKGLGRALLQQALDWAKNEEAVMIYLEVRRSNLAAIQLYLNMDFKQIGERKDYYPAPKGKKEDALIFARDIGIEIFLEKQPNFGK